jgi:single-stranded-DNA-specific exonuclease
MVDRAAAADRIASAIRRNERIAVFGDYDCDGITSAAIVTEIVRALGGEAVPLLASRFEGGYGVSSARVRADRRVGRAAARDLRLRLSDHASLARLAKAASRRRHRPPPRPGGAAARGRVPEPPPPECAFPYKGLASCGLALSIGAALRAALGKQLDLRAYLDLVAIGTIADVAPLDGDNRALVRAGLAMLSKAPRPGSARSPSSPPWICRCRLRRGP